MDTPQWSLGDRLRKAMHHAGLTGQEMAERLQMNPATISDYVNDRTTPRLETVQQWAAETGVSVWWIVDELPRLDSNQQPSGLQIRTHLCPECLTEWQCAETDHDGHALCAECAQVFA